MRSLHGGGFTIVEVLIVLAVTSVLFVATVVAISGQQARTQFTQAMRDAESKFRDLINDASTGYAPVGNGLRCEIVAGRPRITQDASVAQGTNDECVLLGRAVQVSTNADEADKLFIYTVVGRRSMPISVGSSQDVDVNSLNSANPVAAISPPDSQKDLTEEYILRNGLRVVSATGVNSPSGMAGFFVNYHSTVSGSTNDDGTVSALQFPLSPTTQNRSNPVKECLQFNSPCDNLNSQALKEWKVCFERSDGRERAQLTIGDPAAKSQTTVKTEFIDC